MNFLLFMKPTAVLKNMTTTGKGSNPPLQAFELVEPGDQALLLTPHDQPLTFGFVDSTDPAMGWFILTGKGQILLLWNFKTPPWGADGWVLIS